MEFPLQAFLQVKREVIATRRELANEKAWWQSLREPFPEEGLDEKFKKVFEEEANSLEKIKALYERGASARLLESYELGNYNLAMMISEIPRLTNKAELDEITEIIRLTILADADLETQKAYAGNGGCTSLEWLCIFLGQGMGGTYIKNMDQYEACYKILGWVLEFDSRNLFPYFIMNFRKVPEVRALQELVMLKMMYYGYSPVTRPDHLKRIAITDHTCLALLFPYENEHVKDYLHALKLNIDEETAGIFINGFTSNSAGRKFFKTFFSRHPHWLLQYVIDNLPAVIFSLIKRNEQDILIPFLKKFKPAMSRLKDEKGNSLLAYANITRGVVDNTKQLLIQSGML